MYPVVCERNNYNGLTTVMITPNKVPYYSFLETNILLTSKSSILNFFFIIKVAFLYFCYQNLCSFPSFLYTIKKKSKTFFMIILGIHALVMYLTLRLLSVLN